MASKSAKDWLKESALLRDDGKIGEAIDVLERAVATGDESCEICKELARLSLTVNEVRAFGNWCHEAMRLDETDPEPYLMVGRVLVAARRWEEAVETLGAGLRCPAADAGQRREAESLLAEAREQQSILRRANPGFSPI